MPKNLEAAKDEAVAAAATNAADEPDDSTGKYLDKLAKLRQRELAIADEIDRCNSLRLPVPRAILDAKHHIAAKRANVIGQLSAAQRAIG